ncbi:RCC1 domain-containing protein, partial [Streptomyces sp. NPDC002920]
ADGSAVAWGQNAMGALGDGTADSSPTPVTALPPGSGITHVSTSTIYRSNYAY